MSKPDVDSLSELEQQAVDRVYRLLDPPLWLVTAADGDRRGGLIATFVARASIVRRIPRMVFGAANHHHTRELIESSGRFALHLLYPHQTDLARHFGLTTGKDLDKFSAVEACATPGGCPLIESALGWLDCRVETRMDSGDRTVYLAAVEAGDTSGKAAPLTVGGLYASADPRQRDELERLYRRDGETDAAAIERWRASI